MNDVPPPEVAWPVIIGGLFVLIASLAVWHRIARRVVRGESLLAYEPRRPVPWQGIDLVMVVLFFVIAASVVARIDTAWFDVHPEPPPDLREAEPDSAHQLVVLMRYDRSLTTLGWCIAAGVLVAPIAEEFLFRLFFQGWLEAVEVRLRRRVPALCRAVRGLLPVLLTSAVFALSHFRKAEPPRNPEWLLHVLIRSTVINVLTVAFAVGLVRLRVGATWADLGFSAARFRSDARLGVVTFVAIAIPIYVLQVTLVAVLPKGLATDPIPLLFFAVVLGTLYCRTHRIVPSIALHMSLNATSLALAWLFLARGGP
jgi:membrane protease YdiL (CAAX protease family)